MGSGQDLFQGFVLQSACRRDVVGRSKSLPHLKGIHQGSMYNYSIYLGPAEVTIP